MRITVSGLAASGKGTLARAFGHEIDIPHIDLGLIFRSVAYTCREQGSNATEAAEAITSGKIQYERSGSVPRVVVDGKDITKELRLPAVDEHTSILATSPADLDRLERIACVILEKFENVICDGRNAGTTILPNAEFKFHATAPIEIRAARRLRDLRRLTEDITYESVLTEIKKRDERDLMRLRHPCAMPDRAIIINTGTLTINECLAVMRRTIPNTTE